jgi:transcriptional regulator, GntR family
LVKAYHKGEFSLEIRTACIEDHENIIKAIEENNMAMTLDLVKNHYLRADRIFRNKLKIN